MSDDTQFAEYTPIDFKNVPVFWAKLFPGQHDTYKKKKRWGLDICITDDELFEELEDNNFNTKEPLRKVLKHLESEDPKLKAKAENEKARGNFVHASANVEYEKNDEIVQCDPPLVVGPDCEPWSPKMRPGNGTICNVECHAKKWEDQDRVTLYVRAVQIVKFVEAPAGSDLPEAGSTFAKQKGTPGATFKKKPVEDETDVPF